LHGHLGPFLAIGTRMGHIAKNLLKAETKGDLSLHATVRVPLVVPFSCTIDGVQATTHCTVGNQRLSVKSCKGGIRGSFTMEEGGKIVEVSVRRKVFEGLKEKLAARATNEELAEEILQMPENELFAVTSFEPPSNLLNNEDARSDLKTAKNLLIDKNLTLCIVKGGKTLFKSRSRGVTGFLIAVQKLEGNLEGSSVAEKVVGKAVAFLCIHFKIGAVYADTLSRPAKTILEKRSIHVEYNNLVQNILNAERTSLCPIERLVRNVQDPNEAYQKLARLRSPNWKPKILPTQE
jgi:hypothetical protein